MQENVSKLVLFIVVLVLLDFYVLNGLRSLKNKWSLVGRSWFKTAYLSFALFLMTGVLLVIYIKVGFGVRLGFLILFFFSAPFKGFISSLFAS